MTVGELLEQLNGYNRNRIVIMSKDSEGNLFSPLAEVEASKYEPDSTWSGDLVADEDITSKSLDCVVLWPTN